MTKIVFGKRMVGDAVIRACFDIPDSEVFLIVSQGKPISSPDFVVIDLRDARSEDLDEFVLALRKTVNETLL